ncbi:hypothetical protein Tco_0157881 [Tanacetum coccineum]
MKAVSLGCGLVASGCKLGCIIIRGAIGKAIFEENLRMYLKERYGAAIRLIRLRKSWRIDIRFCRCREVGAKDLARPPTLSDVLHSALEEAKTNQNSSNDEEQKEEDDQSSDSNKLQYPKAGFLARDMKSMESDLCYMQERCNILEEENRQLRDGFIKGVPRERRSAELKVIRDKLETCKKKASSISQPSQSGPFVVPMQASHQSLPDFPQDLHLSSGLQAENNLYGPDIYQPQSLVAAPPENSGVQLQSALFIRISLEGKKFLNLSRFLLVASVRIDRGEIVAFFAD